MQTQKHKQKHNRRQTQKQKQLQKQQQQQKQKLRQKQKKQKQQQNPFAKSNPPSPPNLLSASTGFMGILYLISFRLFFDLAQRGRGGVGQTFLVQWPETIQNSPDKLIQAYISFYKPI